jgi:predicted permease
LTESTLLAAAGAATGLLLAYGLKDFFARMLVPATAMWTDFAVPLDSRILAITLGVSVVCGLGAGFTPAVLAAMTIPAHLAVGGRTVTGAARLRAGFAIVQLALSLALLTGAFMLIATLRHFWAIDLGFEPAGVIAHRMSPEQQGYTPERSLAYYRGVFDRVRATPGVMSAAYAASASGPRTLIRIQDPADSGGQGIRAYSNAVSGDYFRTLGIRLIKGRVFAESDAWTVAAASPPIAIVSESFARRLFGDVDPIGLQMRVAGTSSAPPVPLTVVGVTTDVRWNVTATETIADPTLQLYLPLTHPAALGLRSAALMVKSELPPTTVAQLVEAAAMAVDPALPVQSTPLRMELEYRLRDRTTFAWVLSMLGWLGLALAAVGLYGLLVQSVAERTREFGIRIAIGGSRAHIFGLVIRQAGWIGLVGTTAGMVLAYFGAQLIEGQLFGVTRGAVSVYVAAAASLLGVVFLAGLWPAHAATRIDPVEALRAE